VRVADALQDQRHLDKAVEELTTISGQRPVIARARRSIAAFKLRTGNPIGCKVTLRGERMYEFLDKLFNISLPRIKDFKGIPARSFDGRGSMNIGIREQLIFPEIEYDKVDKIRGMDIAIVTTARTDEEARELLRGLGLPFREGAGGEAPAAVDGARAGAAAAGNRPRARRGAAAPPAARGTNGAAPPAGGA
jgi:large subunit ribosomal protein L5